MLPCVREALLFTIKVMGWWDLLKSLAVAEMPIRDD